MSFKGGFYEKNQYTVDLYYQGCINGWNLPYNIICLIQLPIRTSDIKALL